MKPSSILLVLFLIGGLWGGEKVMASETKIKVGDKAPDFTLPNQEGKPVSLKSFLGKKNVVLYFYPKDETPGCTKEACAFRDSYEVFKTEEAEVIGVSSDAVSSHLKFAANHRLPFTLLSDEGGRIRKLYGVGSTMGLIPGRVTYVIDKKGIVRQVFSSQFNAARHVEEALEILKGI